MNNEHPLDNIPDCQLAYMVKSKDKTILTPRAFFKHKRDAITFAESLDCDIIEFGDVELFTNYFPDNQDLSAWELLIQQFGSSHQRKI